MEAVKRSAHTSDSINGADEPATKKANTNESVDDRSYNTLPPICKGYEAKATLSLTTTIESLKDEHEQKGEEVLVGNHLKWYLGAQQEDDYLVVYPRSNGVYKYPFLCDVECTLEARRTQDRIVRSFKLSYDCWLQDEGCDMVEWNILMNDRDKFEVDGKITMTAKIIVRMPMCLNFNSVELDTDVKMSIGDELFPFKKATLAMFSPFFRTMFFGPFKEANQDIVCLKDLNDSDDVIAFVNLINMLFVRCFTIKTCAVKNVLKLADRFGMDAIIAHCEELLMKCERDSEPCLAERLALASKFSLDKLQKRCLELCDSSKIIKEVKASYWYEDISSDVKLMLFDKLCHVLP